MEAAVAVLRFSKQRCESSMGACEHLTYVSICHNLGMAACVVGLTDEATLAYKIAVDLDPTSPDHAVGLALCYYARGDSSQALTTLLQTERRHPDSYRLHYCLGVCYADVGAHKHAWE
jgi:Tfp pilus assembly protein PilF